MEFLSGDEQGNFYKMVQTLFDEAARTSLEKAEEVSAGLAVIRRGTSGDFEVLLILRGKGLEFPKGHLEGTETAEEAAEREVFEEAGVSGIRIHGELYRSRYEVRSRINRSKRVLKTVIIFFATPDDNFIICEDLREKATKDIVWVSKRDTNQVKFKNEDTKEAVILALKRASDFFALVT